MIAHLVGRLTADGFLGGVCDEGDSVSVSEFWFRDICRSRLAMIRARGELGSCGLPKLHFSSAFVPLHLFANNLSIIIFIVFLKFSRYFFLKLLN